VRSAGPAAASSSINSSSSPSRTWGSLWSVIPIRWSVTRAWGKLYVRIRSLRSPVPTWLRRAAAGGAGGRVGERLPDPVVGDPRVGKVVRAAPPAAPPASPLAPPVGGDLSPLLL